MLPSDPMLAICGQEALLYDARAEAELSERFGLYTPPNLSNLLVSAIVGQGETWSYSYYYQTPVTKLILGTLPWRTIL